MTFVKCIKDFKDFREFRLVIQKMSNTKFWNNIIEIIFILEESHFEMHTALIGSRGIMFILRIK